MSAAQQNFDRTLSRVDSILDAQVRRLEAIEAQQADEREEARRVRMRDNAEARREIAARYADAFRAFGTEVPAPADDEPAGAFRKRLFNRLARKLPSGHELSEIRADDISSSPTVYDHFEREVIKAAQAEGEKPSTENLPPSGEIVARHRTDDMGQRMTEFFGKESFIKSMSRPGRRVLRLIDPASGRVLIGAPFSRAD